MDWQWDLQPDHWIELSLTDNGLAYVGVDWTCQSGGAYTAGFQSVEQFLADGPMCQMPEGVAAEVRERLADRGPGHPFEIRLAGPVPDEAHLDLDGQPILLEGTATLFRGSLAAGPHTLTGVLKFPGVDTQGRRSMRRFEARFEVHGPGCLQIDETEPRFED